jgi:hypothetical protein
VTHTAITQWNPLTLQGAGLFHIAMGAVLGIAAFGRTQEKLNGANNGGAQTPATGFAGGTATSSVPSAGFGAQAGGFGSPAPAVTNSFGAQPLGSGSGFGSAPPAPAGFSSSSGFGAGTSPAPATGVTAGFGGKAAPPPQVDPVL